MNETLCMRILLIYGRRKTYFRIYNIINLSVGFISASSNGIAQSNYDMMDSFQNSPVNKRSGKHDSINYQSRVISTFKKIIRETQDMLISRFTKMMELYVDQNRRKETSI